MSYPGGYTGACLCGAIQFRIDAELEPIQICHCSQCRRAQGSAFAANSPVAETAFVLLAGSDRLKEYESSAGKLRVFCDGCGSPVFSRNLKTPGVLRVRAGLINEPLRVRPVAHFYVASKADWWEIGDGCQQFEAGYVPGQKR